MKHKSILFVGVFLFAALTLLHESSLLAEEGPEHSRDDKKVDRQAQATLDLGKQIFRFDTFGDEAWWGDTLKLHQAIAGARNGGVGPGVSPKTALAVGLKVDADALPDALKKQIKAGKVDLDDPATTLALLKLNAVVGVTGIFDTNGTLRSMGLQCAFCHSTVDDSFSPGIGTRLDGWANRDLNVGAIVALAPNVKPIAELLRVDVATVKAVLNSWGPGRFDAELDKDGKALRPDGGQAGTLIPPAFGLAGVNLHTWTGFGSVPYWNAYVAVTEMHGSGTFFDQRLSDPVQYPVSARSGSPSRRRSLPWGASTRLPQSGARKSSTARASARLATFRRCSPNRATTCTRRPSSESIPSRPTARRPTCIAPHRSRDCGRTRRAVSSTTGALPLCGTSSRTTTSSSGSG